MGAGEDFQRGGVWSSEVLFLFCSSPFLGLLSGHPAWAWGFGVLCARNRTNRFMF